jgi:hypothetical protein
MLHAGCNTPEQESILQIKYGINLLNLFCKIDFFTIIFLSQCSEKLTKTLSKITQKKFFETNYGQCSLNA